MAIGSASLEPAEGGSRGRIARILGKAEDVGRIPTIAYVIGLVIVGTLSTAIWMTTVLLISAQEQVAAEVNVAGRQRMLSQRIAMIASNLESFRDATGKDPRGLVLGCADLMERAHYALLARQTEGLRATASEGISCQPGQTDRPDQGVMSDRISGAIFEGSSSLDTLLAEYISLARDVGNSTESPDADVAEIVRIAYQELPGKLDYHVRSIQAEGEESVKDLRLYKTLMWLATLLLLVLEVLLIFRPMTAMIRSAIGRLRETIGTLEERERALADANETILEGIQYAKRIQVGTLPDDKALDGIVDEVAMVWEPLQVVSGDYVWLEQRGDKGILFLCDCTGHGVPGAFITLVVAAALEKILESHALDDPGDILLRLDRAVRTRLRQDTPSDGTAGSGSDDGLEAALCLYDRRTGVLEYAGAGIPLVIKANDAVAEFKADRHRIGYRSVRIPDSFTVHRIDIQDGDTVYLYSDGVPDTMGGEPLRAFGRRRLHKLLSESSETVLSAQLSQLTDHLTAYRGEQQVRDDVSILAFRPIATGV